MLIDALAEPVVKLDEVSESDGEGGIITEYKEGAQFLATISPDNTVPTKIAQKNAEIKAYRVSTKANVKLKKGDLIKRILNKKIYVITQSSDETARIASYQFNICKAEEWELPHE